MLILSAWVLLCAQDPKPQEEPPKKIEEFFITAPQIFDTPYSADVVTSGDIRNRGTRTLPEALSGTPGVHIQRTGPGQSSPVIRGFTGYGTLMLIDGIRLNNSAGRPGPNQYWGTVDQFLIDRLEIVRGPSSVLYGSDAMGGTVYAHTREPDFNGIHQRSIYRFSSAERSHTVREEITGHAGDLGWVVGGTYRDFGDVDGGRHYGEMRGTGFDEYDGDVKGVYRLSDTSKLIVAAQHTRQDDASRWHSTNQSRSWHGTTPGTDRVRDFDQERNLYYVQYHWTTGSGIVDAFKASVSWHRQAEKEDRTTATGAREVREFDVETPGAWMQAGKQTELGYFTLGADYYRDTVNSRGHDWSAAGALTSFARGAIADEATYGLFGIYLQDEFSIGALDVTPGIRFTRAEAQADEVDPIPGDAAVFNELDEDYQAVTGSLRLLYHLDEHWNLIAGWGMGFRAPSLDDSTAIKLVNSGALDLPAEDLDPEKTHTFDLGIRARYSDWEVTAFAFYTILDEFITRVPVGDVMGSPAIDFTKENFSEGWIYGFEVGALYRATEEVSLFANWGYAKGEVEQDVDPAAGSIVADEQPIQKMNPSTLQVGARYVPKESKVWVEGLATAVARQSHLSISEGTDTQRIPPKHGTPGYTVFTVRGGWEVCPNFTTTVAVENIGNKDYRQHGSGVNEPGTNFILGAEVRF